METPRTFNGNINHKLEKLIFNNIECLKKTFDNSEEQQAKLKREICFYKYCEKKSLINVPKVFYFDENSILIQFIKGIQLEQIDLNNIHYFTDFINGLNFHNNEKKIDYAFCGGESVLTKNGLLQNLKIRALNLPQSRLYHPKKFDSIINKHLKLFSLEKINVGKIILSPSDFGLHNFILNEKSPYFFDFEYSGTDSILKCILDFVLHPANKIEFDDLDLYINNFTNSLGVDDFKISKYTINIFCIWWIMRLLNSITNKSIDARIANGLILVHEKDEFIESRISNIQKFYKYI